MSASMINSDWEANGLCEEESNQVHVKVRDHLSSTPPLSSHIKVNIDVAFSIRQGNQHPRGGRIGCLFVLFCMFLVVVFLMYLMAKKKFLSNDF